MAIVQQIQLADPVLEDFCRRWKITAVDVIEAFPATNDQISLLVTFAADARWGLLEHVHMEQELSELSGHAIQLVSIRAIEDSRNALWRGAVLDSKSRRPIYRSTT